MRNSLSSIAELEKILGRRLFNSLISQVFDKKELFNVAAQHMNLSQLGLMIKIADRLGLPVLTKLTDEFEKVPLLGVSEMEQESRGFVLFKSKLETFGVVCLEPLWLTPHAERLSNFPIILSDWETLKSWIHGKITLPSRAEDLKLIPLPSSPNEECSFDLKYFVSSLAALGASDVLLEFRENYITYEMIAPDLHTYRQQIRISNAKGLEQLLSIISAAHPPVINETIEGVKVTIFVGPNTQRRRFHLSWTPTLPTTTALNARLWS